MTRGRLTRRFRLLAAATLILLVVSGCAGSGNDKAGGAGSPMTLRLATSDQVGSLGGKAVEHFAAELVELSHGSLRVKTTYEPAGENPNFDQRVGELVRRGRVDLALVPTRAWDGHGVKSLRALQAPFLIQDEETLDAVVGGELATPMLQGLRAIGVTGLALLPEGFRHPFGFNRPLRSPSDFAGAAIRAPNSEVTYALLRALGARPQNLGGEQLAQAIRDDRLAGAESAFGLAGSTLEGSMPTGTGNLTFFPHTESLVANSRALDKLSTSARKAVTTAAAETRDWVQRTRVDDDAAALAYCRVGGRVVAAGAADARRMEAMARPVYAWLERDATTRRLIAAIGELARHGRAAPAAVTCEPASGPVEHEDTGSTPATDQNLLDGIYRNRTTVSDFTRRHVSEIDAFISFGVHTITLRRGRLHDELIDRDNPNSGIPCDGKFRLDGHRFVFTWNPKTKCTGDFTATWELSDDELLLKNVRAASPIDEIYWGLRPFRKIG